MGKYTIPMTIFNSDVKLPEGETYPSIIEPLDLIGNFPYFQTKLGLRWGIER